MFHAIAGIFLKVHVFGFSENWDVTVHPSYRNLIPEI
jgi:hypothetical protein